VFAVTANIRVLPTFSHTEPGRVRRAGIPRRPRNFFASGIREEEAGSRFNPWQQSRLSKILLSSVVFLQLCLPKIYSLTFAPSQTDAM
jgi:hypothetical protein